MLKLKRNTFLPQDPRLTWFKDIALLSLILLVTYTVWLGHYALFTPDEGRYSEVAREMIATHDYITPRVNGVAFLDKPILYYWLQVIAIQLFGLKEWALRLFPALLGVFGCIMVYITGRSLFDRRTGLLAAFILASSLLYFLHAHYANLDLEVAVLVSSSLLTFIIAIHTHRDNLLYLAYCFAALAFLTKGLIGIVFPIMIIGSWILLQWRFDILKRMKIITGFLLFMMIVLPWYVLVQQANPEFLHFFFVTQQVTRFLSNAEFNNQTAAWFYVPVIMAGFFPWIAFLAHALKYHLRQIKQPLELFLFLWPTLIFIFFTIPQSKIMGYILPVFPPLALIVARYIANHWQHISTTSLRMLICSFQVLSLVFAAMIFIAIHLAWIELSPSANLYMGCITITLLCSALIAFFLYFQKNIIPLFVLSIVTSMIMLGIVLVSAPDLNQNTTKPLTTYLKERLNAQDEVVTYNKFYYDVPLYLERRVTIVNDWESPDIIKKDNWARELWFGMPFQETSVWLINENTFWQRWQKSEKRFYVLMNAGLLPQFMANTQTYFVLARFNDVLLISNHDG